MQLINDGTISIREATINEKAFCFDLIDKTNSKTAAPLLFLDRWLNGEDGLSGYECFLADMGPKPEGMSIDRIDNTKGYSPDNCKWSTAEEQNNNRSSSRYLTIDGVTKTIAQWARVSGIGPKTIRNRLETMHMSPKEAVFTKLKWTKRR